MTGAAIGLTATPAGILLGTLFCHFIGPIQKVVEAITQTPVFNADTYFLSQIPADVQPMEVAVVAACTLALSFLASLPTAWRASRIDPVEALRYE
jgi:lipoprotein-releasing system permease protein